MGKNIFISSVTTRDHSAAQILRGLILLFLTTCFAFAVTAQEPASTPLTLPRPDYHFNGNVGRTYLESDAPQFPVQVKAPNGAPNIVIILIDDAGFGQFGTFGGAIPTPALDQLASEGLKYNRFHTTAICSPTRAALLTGRNHHVAATGGIAESATGFDGYTAILPKRTGMIAEVLRQNGYATAWIGKNHNTAPWEINPRGPFNNWPNAWGFDYFYGFMGGQTSQWHPLIYENHKVMTLSDDPKYHLTTDLVDHAIQWVGNVQAVPGAPYFLYFAPGATHAPHHAPKEWIDKFKGKFDQGWDEYRKSTFERQKSIGVIPANTQLTPRPEQIPEWNSLPADEKKLYARMMEVFAGFTAHVDYETGRLLTALKSRPDWENTLVFYIVGDNGSSAEGGVHGTIDEVSYYNGFEMPLKSALPVINDIGGPTLHNHFPVGWAWAMNTPFQWTKQVASHFGGTRNPMIVTWPSKIKSKGELRSQFHHVIDIAPTIYEVTGITPPQILNGVAQDPIDGTSIAYTFSDAQAKDRRRIQYFEIYANRGIYQDGWFASSIANVPWMPSKNIVNADSVRWELYKIDEDFSQSKDLAEQFPDKLKQMQELWWAEAARNKVLPVDTRPLAARIKPDELPSPTAGYQSLTYYPGVGGILEGAAPHLVGRSFNISADLEMSSATEGMIFTIGGYTAGFGLYVQNERLVFSYNFFTERSKIISAAKLPAGKQNVRMEFKYDGGGYGKGATVILFTDNKKISEGRIERTVPVAYSSFDGIDVGVDRGAPVDFSYKLPFRFTGKLEKVVVDLK